LSKQSFDRKLEDIEALRSAPEESAREQLRVALKDRSNYVAAKAAKIAGERQFVSLIPDLLAAFDRFMKDPAKSDPQCWAKNAIAKSLKDLEHADPAVFLRGMAHFQMEPVWGGRKDTAVTLRGTCALAVIGCAIPAFDVLILLTGLLNDPETPVRADAARAIAQLSAREGILPLRLKALIGDAEPEVVGHCLAALLCLAPQDSLPFVAGFLDSDVPDLRLEAAGVLADSREPQALELLKNFWDRQTDPEVKRSILTFLSGSPLPDSAEFLLSVLENTSADLALNALAALSKSRHRTHVHARAAAIVAARRDRSLTKLLESDWAQP
jgi:HEAT repeat protein